jgi:molybdenum cofactor cytidylyltransferase
MGAVGAIILAAGRARRFAAGADDSKVLAQLRGQALVRHVTEAALASRARPVIVVTGQAGEKVEAALAGLPLTAIRNSDPDLGLSHSLHLGLAALPEGAAGALILLADMPYVTAALIDRLITAFTAAAKPPHAVVPLYKGQRGNPVLLGAGFFQQAMTISGDRGARALLEAAGADVLDYPIDDDAIMIDIDTREALAKLEARNRA